MVPYFVRAGLSCKQSEVLCVELGVRLFQKPTSSWPAMGIFLTWPSATSYLLQGLCMLIALRRNMLYYLLVSVMTVVKFHGEACKIQ